MKRSVWKPVVLVLVSAVLVGALLGYKYVLTPRRFVEVAPRRLYRSAQLHGWGWNVLKRHNIATVINLRPAAEDPEAFREEQSACEGAGVKLIHIPIAKMPPTEDQIARFLRAAQSSGGGVMVHCEHGKTRTGMLVAAYRVVFQDWDLERAWGEMIRLGDKETASQREQKMALLSHFNTNRERYLSHPDAASAQVRED
jgi:uncharacterized protein (TIGR01244 family)